MLRKIIKWIEKLVIFPQYTIFWYCIYVIFHVNPFICCYKPVWTAIIKQCRSIDIIKICWGRCSIPLSYISPWNIHWHQSRLRNEDSSRSVLTYVVMITTGYVICMKRGKARRHIRSGRLFAYVNSSSGHSFCWHNIPTFITITLHSFKKLVNIGE